MRRANCFYLKKNIYLFLNFKSQIFGFRTAKSGITAFGFQLCCNMKGSHHSSCWWLAWVGASGLPGSLFQASCSGWNTPIKLLSHSCWCCPKTTAESSYKGLQGPPCGNHRKKDRWPEVCLHAQNTCPGWMPGKMMSKLSPRHASFPTRQQACPCLDCEYPTWPWLPFLMELQ